MPGFVRLLEFVIYELRLMYYLRDIRRRESTQLRLMYYLRDIRHRESTQLKRTWSTTELS